MEIVSLFDSFFIENEVAFKVTSREKSFDTMI